MFLCPVCLQLSSSFIWLKQLWRLTETFLQSSNWRLISTAPLKKLTQTVRKQFPAFANNNLQTAMENSEFESKTLCKDSCSKDYLPRPTSIETISNCFLLLVKLFEELKTLCLVLILVLFV